MNALLMGVQILSSKECALGMEPRKRGTNGNALLMDVQIMLRKEECAKDMGQR